MADSLTRKKLLARIRKVLALGSSPHPHEAAAALAKAQALMEAHGITEAEIRVSDVREVETSTGRVMTKPPRWLHSLSATVASAFSVRTFHYVRGGFCFIGAGNSAEIAEYTFVVLRRELERSRRVYYRSLRGKRSNKIRKADDYALGWVFAVRRTVDAFAKPVPDVVEEYLAIHHASISAYEPLDRGRDRDRRHLISGFVDGEKVEINRPVEGAASTNLLN